MKFPSFKFLLCTLLVIIELTSAQPAEPKVITSPGPNVPGIPKITDNPDSDYQILLSYSLYFYEAQRSGVLPKSNRVPWRHSSGLKDGASEGIDLVGGYYDAGDYMKFTLPLSWSLTMISWGGIEWFDGYEISGQSDYLFDMVKWGTDWLIKAHSLDSNDLYVQIALENVDHNYWGPDNNIPVPRPAFKIGKAAHGTDVAAETVAAFASSSILFRDRYSNTEYSDLLVTHAKRLFEFAETKQLTVYSNSVPQVKGLYDDTNFRDKLVWASLWLYRATEDPIYLTKARNYFRTFGLKGSTLIINWAEKTSATYFLFVQVTNGTKSPDERFWRREAERYLDFMLNPKAPCSYTRGGLLFCDGDSESNSLNIPLNIAFVSLVYAPYATPKKAKRYRAFAQSQIRYLLGNNPMGMTYVVGANAKSPKNPHHAGAHGSTTNDLNNPAKTKNIIYGAIVGGPDKNDLYVDDRNRFDYSEVALDYNAPWQGLMAYEVMALNPEEVSATGNGTDSGPGPGAGAGSGSGAGTATETPASPDVSSTTSSQSSATVKVFPTLVPAESSTSTNKVSTKTIVGIVVGIIGSIGLIGACIFFNKRSKISISEELKDNRAMRRRNYNTLTDDFSKYYK